MMHDSKTNHEIWHGWINRRVLVKESMLGTLKFFGETDFGEGLWCGIELDKPLGKNDGMVNSIRYFACEPRFGIFVPLHKVTKIKDNNLEEQFFKCKNLNETYNMQEQPALAIIPEAENEENKFSFCEKLKEKLSSSSCDSEESLGILNPEVLKDFDASWDSVNHDSALDGISPNNQISSKGNLDFVFPPVTNNKIFDEFSDPISSSTPRHFNKKHVFGDIVKYPLAFTENAIEKNLVCEETHLSPELFFDVNKLKTSNLSSTLALGDQDNVFKKLNSTSSVDLESNAEQDKKLAIKEQSFQNSGLLFCNNTLSDTFEIPEKISEVSMKKFSQPECNISYCDDISLKTCIKEKLDNCHNLSYVKDMQIAGFNLNKKNELNSTFKLKSPGKDLMNLPAVEIATTADMKLNETQLISSETTPFKEITNNNCKNESLLKQTFIIDSSITELYDNSYFQSDPLVCNKSLEKTFSNNMQCVPEEFASHNIILDSPTKKDKCLPFKICSNLSAGLIKMSNSNIASSNSQKVDQCMMKDIPFSSKNTKLSNVPTKMQNDSKLQHEFKKPFSPTSSKLKPPSLSRNSAAFNKKKEKVTSKPLSLKSNRRETLTSNLNNKSNFCKNEKWKCNKRSSLTSTSLETNISKTENLKCTRRSSVASNASLETNISKTENLKCTRRSSVASTASLKNNSKGENLKYSRKSSLISKSDLRANISKQSLKSVKASLASNLDIDINFKNVDQNITTGDAKLNCSFNFEEKSKSISKFGNKRYSFRIPSKVNKKNEIVQDLINCHNTRLSEISAVPNIKDFKNANHNVSRTDRQPKSSSDSDQLNKTLVFTKAVSHIGCASKKSVSNLVKMKEASSFTSSQSNKHLTQIPNSDYSKNRKQSNGIKILKKCSAGNLTSGIKIPQYATKKNCYSTLPFVGIAKPFITELHTANVAEEKLETENSKPSSNFSCSRVPAIKQITSASSKSVSAISGGSIARSISKQMDLSKKTSALPLKIKTVNERTVLGYSSCTEKTINIAQKIPRFSLSTTGPDKRN